MNQDVSISSDSACDSVAHDPVKTTGGVGSRSAYSFASACDSDNVDFTRS